MLVDGGLAQIGTPRVGRRHRPGARPDGLGDRVADLRPGAASRRWRRTPACRSSTRSPTSSTPASCSPTCRPSRSTRARSPASPSRSSATPPTTCRTRSCSPAPPPACTCGSAAPTGFTPDPAVLAEAPARSPATTGGSALYVADPVEAVTGADVVVTDTWVSMGKEDEADERSRAVPALRRRPRTLLGARRRTTRSCCTACRPTAARRSPPTSSTARSSVVWDEAENRLHAQKALLTWLWSTRR